MNKIEKIVSLDYDKKKIREFLKEGLGYSTRLIRGAAIDKRLFVNGKVVKLNHIVFTGDKVEIVLSKDESQNIEPEKMDLDIVYEDEDILVINKEPYMVVHPTKSHGSGTLANGVLYYFKEKGENCIVRLVSRLDMNTSGLIIIAKNQFAHMSLSREMQGTDFKKIYLAVTHGNLKEEKGTIDLPIYRPNEDTIKRIVDDKGQRSITHYEIKDKFNNGQLVELLLETGRTHQIRVHLSHLGCPIYGDNLYGEEDGDLIQRQALHAYGLEFKNPRTGKVISLRAGLPQDIKDLIEKVK